jgi:hypothetical protein
VIYVSGLDNKDLAAQTGFELAIFWLNGVSTQACIVRLSAYAWVVLDGMGLELAGEETPPGKPAASGNVRGVAPVTLSATRLRAYFICQASEWR